MMSLSRMIPLGLVVIGLCTSGCSTWPASHGIQSRSARTGDGASFDAPDADGAGRLAHKRGAKPGDAMHYYTNQRLAMVARPARYRASELARVEVWWTDNNGFHWHKAGRFEQGQAFFPLDVKEDGDYGIRFVGPGEEPAQRVLAFPERTYHVDTVQPVAQVLVDPEQADYHVGDLVSIDWMVQDFQLEKHPVTIEVLYDRGDAGTRPVEFQRDLPDEGSVTYRIPPEALGREITFRVEARDRSGNLGLAYSEALLVVEDPLAAELAEAEMDESQIDSTDRVAVATPDEEKESDAAVSVEEEGPVLVVGPILVPIADTVIDSDLVVADILSDTTDGEQRATNEAKLAAATRLMEELKSRATMLASRVVEAMGGVVDGWVASAIAAEEQRAISEAKLAAATRLTEELKSRATMLASRVVDAMDSVVDGWVASAKLVSIEDEAATQTPASVAVAAVEADDAEADNTAEAENLDQGQASQTPPTFAVVEQQPIDESAADVHLPEPLVASAAQTEAEEADTRPTGSMFLEIGPQIVMAEELFVKEPAPSPLPAEESTPVAISEPDETYQLDASADAPQMNQRQPDAPSLAVSDKGMADEAEDPSPDRVAPRSSDLPFATAIARLPAIDSQRMDEDSAQEGFPSDDATTRGPDITEPRADTTEPSPEEDAHPQVSALASAEQETNGEEQLADTTVAEETGDTIDEQNQDSAAIEIVASAEQSEDEEPFLPALSIESLTALDPTRGNGLLIPLPATLEDEAPLRVTAHPWRILGRHSGSVEEAIWALPERRSDVRWRPVFTGRFLADDPAPRDVAEPDKATHPTLAGTTEEMIDGEASDEP